LPVGDADAAAERQRSVRRGQGVHVEPRAARRAPAVMELAVPGGGPHLAVAAGLGATRPRLPFAMRARARLRAARPADPGRNGEGTRDRARRTMATAEGHQRLARTPASDSVIPAPPSPDANPQSVLREKVGGSGVPSPGRYRWRSAWF